MRKFYFLLFTLVLLASTLNAQVSVTATAGTPGPTPYTTLKDAFDAINLGTHQGNISISLSGNTTETATAALNASGSGSALYTSVSVTATAPVTISGSIVGAIIKLVGADNVTIDGRIGGTGRNITVSNTNTSTATAAIWITSTGVGAGATNNVIRNLEIACGVNQTTSSNTSFGIILCSNNTSISTTSNSDDCDNNSFIANRIIRCRYGIVTRGTTTNLTQNTVVTDNIIGPAAFGADQIGKVGILMQADQGAIVSRNTVQFVGKLFSETNTTGADRVGIGIGQESWSTLPSTLTSNTYTVTANIIHDIVEERTFSACGLILATTGGGSATNNLVANNFIYNVRANGTAGDQTVGLGIAGGHTDKVVFNSIYLSGDVDPGSAAASTNYGSGIRIANTNGTTHLNLLLQNNSVYMDLSSSSTAANRYYAISGNSNAYSFGTGGENHNNYYINAANPQTQTGGLGSSSGNTLTTQFATLANWQTAYTSPQDANSIQANPNHISATDLHIPIGSPNAGAGQAVAGVLFDIDAQLRDATVDIGGDDPTGITPPANDMSATAFLNPVIGENKSSVIPFSPQATYINIGSSSQAGVTVRFRIVNSVSTEVYNNTQTIANIAGSGGSANVTFSAVALPPDNYTMFARAELAGDGNTTNDEITGTFTVVPPLSGTYTVGSGGNYPSLTNNGGIFEALNQAGASANITINIISDLSGELGTHSLNEIAGGFTVLIRPFGSPRTITGSNTGALIKLNGADGVTIDGSTTGSTVGSCLIGGDAAIRELTIQNTNTGTSAAVIAVQSGTNGAMNNTVKNINVLGQDPTTTLIGISVGGNTPGTTGIDNDNNSVINCSVKRAIFGIYSAGQNLANQNLNTNILNNDLSALTTDRIRRVGIVVFNETNANISYNSIATETNEGADAIGIGVGNQAISSTTTTPGGVTNSLVANNKINGIASLSTTGFSAAGISVAGDVGGSNIIRNNMISGVTAPSTSPDLVAGIFVVGATGSDTRLYNNTVSMTGDRGTVASQMPSYAIAITGTNPTVELKNNIFHTTQIASGGGVNAKSYAIGMVSTTFTNLNSNNNNFWSSGANAGGFRTGSLSTAAGTDYATLALWQAAISGDANSQNVDPVFVSSSDLHLSNALGTNWCLNNSGVNIASVTDDFDCQSRNNPPDIGADEFTAVSDDIATPSSQTICSGNTITTIVLSGSATSYNWTRDNTATVTGIAANGTGNISGSLTNTTNAPVTVTFTITPVTGSCNGPAFTATVLVNPIPNAVATPSSQTICSGATITTIALTGAVGGTTFNWTRDNTGTVTGIVASGAGDISGALTNTTNAPVTVTFTITPTANGCPGTPITATVLVNPTPNAVATPSSQSLCSGFAITTITLTGNVSGTTFNWTRDNPGVTGIPASGSGDISGTLVNTSGLPVTVTFTITPTANGCPGTPITATVLVNPVPSVSGSVTEPLTCASADGAIDITVSGAAGPYTFLWTGPGVIPANEDQTGLTVGNYSVTVTVTATGCQTTANFALAGPGGCSICPTIGSFTSSPSGTACSVDPITLTASGLTDMGTTYGITFKRSAAPLADPYIGGTVIATVPNGSLTSGGTVATTTSTLSAGNYYLYAIISPTPVDIACRPSQMLSLTVGQTPDVNQPANQIVCNNGSTAPVNFTGSVPGTVYNWINSDPSIGLAASGSGDIPSFLATNSGTTPIVSTITVTPQYTSTGGPITQTFNYSGAMETWVVPAGVTSITINAYGAEGGSGANGNSSGGGNLGGAGGRGSQASGTLAVTPGQVLNIFVGGSGATPAAGFNGGGTGGNANSGGGGGASDVRVGGIAASNRVIVAGGGGGGGRGGCETNSAINGGAGGNGDLNGNNGTSSPDGGGGFGGITGGAGGAAGIGCGGFLGQPGVAGSSLGIGGDGGAGQTCCCFSFGSLPGGGGGGGGFFGGGGAGGGSAGTTGCSGNNKGGGGGGAGGTSYIGGISSGSIISGVQSGNGLVTITYLSSFTCTGSPTTFTYTVNPTPNTVATPSSQTICSGATITTIVLSGNVSGTTYNWTRDNTGSVTGIGASGSGNISGTLTNTTNAPVTVTFTITPTANGCPGAPITATVLVNPTPNAVATPSTQTVCTGTAITTIVLSGNVSGTTYNWTRDNTVNVTGLANNGSGNISGTPVNNTTVQQTVTYTITPTANGCPGTPITATVIVNPTPTVTCPANIVRSNDPGVCGAIVNYPPATATGTPAPTVTYSIPSGSLFPLGTTTVTVTATNACGTATCSFTVTVNDTEPPVITCPANIVRNNDPGMCGAIVTFFPTVTDNCPIGSTTAVTINQSSSNAIVPGSVSCNTGGIHTDNSYWRVYDLAPLALVGPYTINRVRFGIETANGTGGTQPVNVRIYTQSGAAFPGGTRTLVRSQTFAVPNQAGTVFAANLTLPVTVPANAIVVLELNTPAGPGNSFFIGSNPAAESGPSYLSAAACAVTVPATTGSIGFPNMHIVLFAEGTVPVPGSGTTSVPASGSFFPVGTTTVVSTATDGSGNTSTCTFTVTVNDAQAPTITCPANIVRTTDPGTCTSTFAPPNPVTADNCAVTQLTWAMTGATTGTSPATGINNLGTRTFNLGVTTVTYTVRDAAGNQMVCSFTVTVNDGAIPAITTQPANRTVCAGANATFTVTATNAVSYQWQSWNGSAWVNITGATASSLTLNNVTLSMNTNSYRVIVIGLCTNTTSTHATLYVNPIPTINLTTSIAPNLLPGQVLDITATTAPSGGSYVWFKNGTVIAGASGNVLAGLTVSDAGTYRVVYTSPDGCTVTSADVVITAQQSGNLYVYPVPNNGQFTVRYYNQANEQVTIRVIDAKGALVYQRKVQTTLPYTTINVNLADGRILTSGVYVVEIRGADGRLVGTRKIIVYQ